MNIENLDPGESSVIEDNTSEIMLDKNEEECACASSGKKERSNNKDKEKRFVYSWNQGFNLAWIFFQF